MTIRIKSLFAVVGLALVTIAATSCVAVSNYPPPLGSRTTSMVGWERHFALEWTADPEPGGLRRIRGYITNEHGEYAVGVRVLAQALDPSGAVLGQRIAFVPFGVAGFHRAYFEVWDLPPGDHYRVSVWDYSFLQSARVESP